AVARVRFGHERAAELLDLGHDDIHADAAARMLRHRACRTETRFEDELQRLLVAQDTARRQQSARLGTFANRLDVDPAAVVLEHDHHLRAFAMQTDFDRARLGLAAGDALFRTLDAMHDRVAQHVLERRQHALEHLPIELAGSAHDHELRALVRLARDLADETRETLDVALERHHARAHESVLQLRHDARLLQEQVLRLARQILEQALDAGDVAHRFGERPRQLLNRRIAIELERIEIGAIRMLFFVAMQDLRFGLELELA